MENELLRIHKEVLRKEKINNRISYIHDALSVLERKIVILENILEKEERDYLRVSRKSLYTTILKIYIDYDKLKDKEYQEYIEALSSYLDVTLQIKSYQKELTILEESIKNLFGIEKRRDILLDEKAKELRNNNHPAYLSDFQSLIQKLSSREQFDTELSQAL